MITAMFPSRSVLPLISTLYRWRSLGCHCSFVHASSYNVSDWVH